ncbi:MAG: phage holin family protein [Ruminococcus sp.]|nr:phage holin family protein [Ruminococcus sp.]
MKHMVCTILGMLGSIITGAFGGWDGAFITLLIFMSIDYVSGLAVALVFRKSPKTKSGGGSSSVGWKGLCRKGMILLIVLVAYRLDLVLGTEYIRNTAIIGFIANETISITENAGLMGVPLPKVITKAIDILNDETGGDN